LLNEFFNPHVLELFGSLVALIVLVAIAARVIKRIRPKPIQQELGAGELLAKYHELHSRGELSDAEFRTIRTTLARRFPNELKGEDETGCDA